MIILSNELNGLSYEDFRNSLLRILEGLSATPDVESRDDSASGITVTVLGLQCHPT
jgi:hypothetical protein